MGRVGLTTNRLREHERACLDALDRYGRVADDFAWALQIYGFAERPTPEGWSVDAARRAAQRLERRGVLVAKPGAPSFGPRAWKRAEDVN